MVGLKPPEVPPTAAVKFVSAGLAGCIADLCTFPLDTAKVRLQVRSAGSPKPRGQREHPGTWGWLRATSATRPVEPGKEQKVG